MAPRPALRTPKKKTPKQAKKSVAPATKKSAAKSVKKVSATKSVKKVSATKSVKKVTRVSPAVEAELARLLAETGTVVLGAVNKSIGAPLTAVTAAAESLVARGDVHLFATAKGDALSRTWNALDAATTQSLRNAVAAAHDLFGRASSATKGVRRQVAREDVGSVLAPVVEAFATEADPRRLNVSPILAALEELAQVGPPDADAVSVPALVLFLTSSGAFPTPREALAAVVFAAGLGHLELLPDGGLGLLADVDADLCPHGAQGTPLRWARRPETTFTAREERRPPSLSPSRANDAAAGLELERVDAWSAELFDPEEPGGL